MKKSKENQLKTENMGKNQNKNKEDVNKKGK